MGILLTCSNRVSQNQLPPTCVTLFMNGPLRVVCTYLDDPTEGEGDDGEVSESPPSLARSLPCRLQQRKQFNKTLHTCRYK